MTDKLDIALIADSNGDYDIEIGDDGDLRAVDGFETSIIMSLLTDGRASPSEVAEPYNRRGFIGDEFFQNENFRHGSKLWLLEQSRNTSDTRNAAVNYAEQALQWMVNDGHLISVSARGSLRVEGIELSITGTALAGNTESFSYQLWRNTLGEN